MLRWEKKTYIEKRIVTHIEQKHKSKLYQTKRRSKP